MFFACAPYASWEDKKTYLEIAQDPKTRIVEFEDCVWQGRPMKVLECQFSIIHPGTHKPVEVTRFFYFAPNDGWICCGLRGGVSPKTKEYIEELYFYEPEQGENLPKLKRMEKWLRNSQNSRQDKLINTTDIVEFRRVPERFPDADFRLSAFGLPEPMGVEQPEPSRTWIWLIVAAIGAGLIAVVFAWLKRRSATANAAKT